MSDSESAKWSIYLLKHTHIPSNYVYIKVSKKPQDKVLNKLNKNPIIPGKWCIYKILFTDITMSKKEARKFRHNFGNTLKMSDGIFPENKCFRVCETGKYSDVYMRPLVNHLREFCKRFENQVGTNVENDDRVTVCGIGIINKSQLV